MIPNTEIDEARLLLAAVAMHALLQTQSGLAANQVSLVQTATAIADALLAELEKPV